MLWTLCRFWKPQEMAQWPTLHFWKIRLHPQQVQQSLAYLKWKAVVFEEQWWGQSKLQHEGMLFFFHLIFWGHHSLLCPMLSLWNTDSTRYLSKCLYNSWPKMELALMITVFSKSPFPSCRGCLLSNLSIVLMWKASYRSEELGWLSSPLNVLAAGLYNQRILSLYISLCHYQPSLCAIVMLSAFCKFLYPWKLSND